MDKKELKIDKTWTLFLDRDGVINERLHQDYVKEWQNFRFLPGAKEGLGILAGLFDRIIIVTNQQGIGKKLMTEGNLGDIHERMLQEISDQNGRIDKIYFCGSLAGANDIRRKPNTGMAMEAKRDFPEIDFSKSIMVGDTASDIKFGKDAGMITVLVSDSKNDIQADYYFRDLLDFAHFVLNNSK